jgi:hypothetical protein
MSQCHTQSDCTRSGPFGLLTFSCNATVDEHDETELVASEVENVATDDSQFHQPSQTEPCDPFEYDDLFMLSDQVVPLQSPFPEFQDLNVETGNMLFEDSPTISLLGFPIAYSEDLADLSFSVVKQLLDHYQQHVITLYTPAPSKLESPWKILHLPKVMSSFGEVMLTGNGADVNLCLLFAILATSAFSMQSDSEHPSDRSSSYWRDLGESYKARAKARLKLALTRISANNAETFKYKDFLMALLSMVTTGVRVFIRMMRIPC